MHDIAEWHTSPGRAGSGMRYCAGTSVNPCGVPLHSAQPPIAKTGSGLGTEIAVHDFLLQCIVASPSVSSSCLQKLSCAAPASINHEANFSISSFLPKRHSDCIRLKTARQLDRVQNLLSVRPVESSCRHFTASPIFQAHYASKKLRGQAQPTCFWSGQCGSKCCGDCARPVVAVCNNKQVAQAIIESNVPGESGKGHL